jgi:hypothetical protein
LGSIRTPSRPSPCSKVLPHQALHSPLEPSGEIDVSQSPWHRHVSPIFFLLLVVAGLMLGFVAFFLLPDVAHAVGR